MESIIEIFDTVETEREYDGYFYSVGEMLRVVILGSICGLKNLKQIHQWATNDRVSEFLKEKFGISRLPCYYWFLCILKLVKPASLNACFVKWVQMMLPAEMRGKTIAIDGKTIRSTGKMRSYESPLHIVSAQLGELGLTFGQKSVNDKSNEIPAVQELLGELTISGCLVVADALNCQKETARLAIAGGADYLLSVKDNQPALKGDIEEYVQDTELRQAMKTSATQEQSRDRFEIRTAYITNDISWLPDAGNWEHLTTLGAIHTQFKTADKTTSEWHYYISSRDLTADELLHYARTEWSVETMHWMLDVHFSEDFCRVEDKNTQQNLNIIRKIALNILKSYKQNTSSKRPVSNIMFDCLLDCQHLLAVYSSQT